MFPNRGEGKTEMNGERMPKHFDFVLLGGGPASVSAAETLRAEAAKSTILLISEEDCLPYGHTYLPKQFLLGTQLKEKLLIHREAYYQEKAIELMLGTRATGVDTAARLVRTDRGRGIHFDKLLIATGAKPAPNRARFRSSRHSLSAHLVGCRSAQTGRQG
jgi:NADPH-dependent 2,4-dienoyl-CoA reductase/sulfur reductase-like enzyme